MAANMNSVIEIAQKTTPGVYNKLKIAVELGKWPDGRRLTEEQIHHALQLIIAYEQLHNQEQDRTGYVSKPKNKGNCG